ncbi:hypothetical protein FNH22_30645 [Fulvivirga sp. M361]|uniref:hypothetical protein n=1 Tax=Fulvivirga sp. M361 TaxID=2594266 RepID=UPI00117A7873|nr:hypothetical protein [Fulvivirga sp. M361]TRX47057.1 hypothetical protein FNH22_30645 [Fulvivirga sp. M361]
MIVYTDKSEPEFADFEHYVLNLAIGKDVNFNEKLGVSIDMGYFVVLKERAIPKNKEAFRYINGNSPSFRFQVFYKF